MQPPTRPPGTLIARGFLGTAMVIFFATLLLKAGSLWVAWTSFSPPDPVFGVPTRWMMIVGMLVEALILFICIHPRFGVRCRLAWVTYVSCVFCAYHIALFFSPVDGAPCGCLGLLVRLRFLANAGATPSYLATYLLAGSLVSWIALRETTRPRPTSSHGEESVDRSRGLPPPLMPRQ